MKTISLLLLCVLFFCGCKTSNVQSRRAERAAAYVSLPPEIQSLVDQGKIKVGMSMDAVYIAWGKPSQILTGETDGKTTTTWLYHGTTLEEHRYWTHRYYHPYGRHYYFPETYMETDYHPRRYTRAEVVFEDGVVKSWRELERPPHY